MVSAAPANPPSASSGDGARHRLFGTTRKGALAILCASMPNCDNSAKPASRAVPAPAECTNFLDRKWATTCGIIVPH